LRKFIAANNGGLLLQITQNFVDDVKYADFDWIDIASKEMAVMINTSLENVATEMLMKQETYKVVE